MKISSVSKKVLASALSAAMVVAFAPTIAFGATTGAATNTTTLVQAEAMADATATGNAIVGVKVNAQGLNEYTVFADLAHAWSGGCKEVILAADYAPTTAEDAGQMTIDLNGHSISEIANTDGNSITFKGTGSFSGTTFGEEVVIAKNADVTVKGGTFSKGINSLGDGAKLTIAGGDFSATGATATVDKAGVTISGGVFDKDISATSALTYAKLAEGVTVQQIASTPSDKYVVLSGTGAKVKVWDSYGNKVEKGMSIESALYAVENWDADGTWTARTDDGKAVEQVITLTADATVDDTIVLRGSWTLDGAGYTLTAGKNLTTKVIDIVDAATVKNVTIANGAKADGVYNRSSEGTLTNVTITGSDASVSGNMYGVTIESGAYAGAVKAKAIKAGAFTATAANAIDVADNGITGGTFTAQADGNKTFKNADCVATTHVAYPTFGTKVVTAEGADKGKLLAETYVVERGIRAIVPDAVDAGGTEADVALASDIAFDDKVAKQGISAITAAGKSIAAAIHAVGPDTTTIPGLTLKSGKKALDLQNVGLTVTLDAAQAGYVTGNNDDAALKTAAEKATTNAVVSSQKVTVKAGLNGVAAINDFGTAAVKVTFTPAATDKKSAVSNYYAVMADGTVVPATLGNDGNVTFKAQKMGTYAIIFGDEIKNIQDETSKADEELQKQIAALQDEVAVAKVAGASKTVKLAKGVKKTKKAQTVTLKSVASASGAKVVYKKSSGSKYITVKGAKATLKKGVKKATYTAKVKATIGEATKTVTVKFVVK